VEIIYSNFMRRTSLQNANILNLWRHCRLPERKDDLKDLWRHCRLPERKDDLNDKL
jgi:hypothetical protein